VSRWVTSWPGSSLSGSPDPHGALFDGPVLGGFKAAVGELLDAHAQHALEVIRPVDAHGEKVRRGVHVALSGGGDVGPVVRAGHFVVLA
jgi:hypothetical protein